MISCQAWNGQHICYSFVHWQFRSFTFVGHSFLICKNWGKVISKISNLWPHTSTTSAFLYLNYISKIKFCPLEYTPCQICKIHSNSHLSNSAILVIIHIRYPWQKKHFGLWLKNPKVELHFFSTYLHVLLKYNFNHYTFSTIIILLLELWKCPKTSIKYLIIPNDEKYVFFYLLITNCLSVFVY